MQIDQAINAFKEGKLVAIPTETVYGLAAPIDQKNLLESIFCLKERPFFDPLIVHVADLKMAKRYASDWCQQAESLANSFWPGPLTIVVTKSDLVDDLVTSGLPSVGLRMPDKEITLDLIQKIDVGLAAPSANKFTKTSPTSISHVRKYFGESEVYCLDGGECRVGIESTIVEICDGKVSLLRPGMITIQEIKAKTGIVVTQIDHKVLAPGNFKVHYKPDYPVVVVAQDVVDERFLKRFDNEFGGVGNVMNVDEEAALFARSLYAKLHDPLESAVYKVINLRSYQSSSKRDDWQGILDRLKKASRYFLVD
jgi:L-threonylcarbamoyladenylate synthase